MFCVHAELPRECVYEKSVLRTCRIGVILHVGRACFSYMQNWGPCACRCGMFFVQGGPETPSAKWEHAELPRVRKVFIAHEASM